MSKMLNLMRLLGVARVATLLAIVVLAASVAESAPAASSARCDARLVKLVDTLTALDSRLDVGLSYRRYQDLLSNANLAYKRVRFKGMVGACLSNVGVPAERALNNYFKAYDVWKRCIDDEYCDDPNDFLLQRHWRNAHVNVVRANNNLTD